MSVDFLRSCYRSEWSLFRDDPVMTPGAYYFSPPDAVHFPGFHHWGSRNWQDRNWQQIQGLGESVSKPHVFVKGVYDGKLPEQRPAGTLVDAAQGTPIAKAASEGELFDGYPVECYIPRAFVGPLPPLADAIGPDVRYFMGTVVHRCTVQRLWATVIEWIYDDRSVDISNLLHTFLGNDVNVFWFPSTETMPATVIVRHPRWSMVACDGTRNFLQLAFQGFGSLFGPTNQGAYGTVPLWQAAARRVVQRMASCGVDASSPIFLTGHSYGAATVAIVASMLKWWTPNRPIKYLLFGCPKIGDERLAALLARCDGVALANDNDFVTSIPPDRLTSAALVPLFPLINFGLLADWERPEGTTLMLGNGTQVPGPPVTLDFGTLFGMVTRIVAAQDPSPVLGHPITEYARRLELVCPDACFPINEEVAAIMDSEDVGGDPGVLLGGDGETPAETGGVVVGGDNAALMADGGVVIGGDGETLPPADGGVVIGGDGEELPPADGGVVIDGDG